MQFDLRMPCVVRFVVYRTAVLRNFSNPHPRCDWMLDAEQGDVKESEDAPFHVGYKCDGRSAQGISQLLTSDTFLTCKTSIFPAFPDAWRRREVEQAACKLYTISFWVLWHPPAPSWRAQKAIGRSLHLRKHYCNAKSWKILSKENTTATMVLLNRILSWWNHSSIGQHSNTAHPQHLQVEAKQDYQTLLAANSSLAAGEDAGELQCSAKGSEGWSHYKEVLRPATSQLR